MIEMQCPECEKTIQYNDWELKTALAEIERLRTALVVEQERCAKIAESPGFIQAQDTEWDEGVNYAKKFIAAAIRAPEQEVLK